MIRTKRIYEPAESKDGHRVLVDRLWPRGVTRERASIDQWLKELAPSNELRKWFHKSPEQWDEFQRRYVLELNSPGPAELVEQLRERAASGTVTLLSSVRNEDRNHAIVLRSMLLGQRDEHGYDDD